MDYEYFDKVLLDYGLDQDPAFENMRVEIAPLPAAYKNVLGLYYPDLDRTVHVEPGTIWLPPDADEETELHELGHRVGHFYRNDLSEKTAEEYRMAHRLFRTPSMLDTSEDHTTRNVLITAGLIAVSIAVFTKLRRKKS